MISENFEVSVKIEPKLEPDDGAQNSGLKTDIKVERLESDNFLKIIEIKEEISSELDYLDVKQEPEGITGISPQHLSENSELHQLEGDTKKLTNNSSTTEKTKEKNTAKDLQCPLCSKKLENKKNYNNHLLVHSAELKLKCSLCNKKYLQKKYLLWHFLNRHANEDSLHCNICDMKLSSKLVLEEHLLTHSDTTYSCDLCMEDYSCKTHLIVHLKKHVGGSFYICKFCRKEFETKTSLTLHEATHTGKKLFCCDVCGVTFIKVSKLTRHMTIHTGEKRTKCQYCEKRFMRIEHLRRHEMTHL